MSVFDYQKDGDGIVTITMDMTGPVNAMNAEYTDAMGATIARLEAETDLTGVVFASAKKTFFAGGDLKELLALEKGCEESFFNQVETEKGWLRRLEKLPVPVVAAINGAALGGGFEICLACNYRLAWNDTSVVVGLPEVSLGLLPGAGGVVRLTNLIGLEQALPYLLEGKKVTADKALAAGLISASVDELDQLLPQAKAWILAQQGSEEAAQQPWDRKGFKLPGGKLTNPKVMKTAMFAPYLLMQKTRGLMPAPERILETAVEAAKLDIDTALRLETRNFVSLVTTPQAKNMITAFFFQMNKVNGGASRPDGIAPTRVKKVGILGAGMMGQGIAYVSAKVGIEVVLKDVSLEAAEKGKAYSAKLMDKAIQRGRADEAQKEALLGLITATDSDEDLAGCDLIVEAVFEDLELKHKLTRASEPYLAEGGVWGSNTSTLPITRLAEASEKPANFVGIHFFSPVDKMPLVELICGEQTSDETLAKAFDYVRQIRKTPIVVNDHLGFFTSRTFGSQLFEAAQLVAEGVHPQRIDALGKAIGMPVGPLTVHDEVSQQLTVRIDATQSAMGKRQANAIERPEGIALLANMVHELDRKGRHYGGGYFDYSESGKTVSSQVLDRYYKAEVDISDADIKDRLLFSSVIESLRCLQEGVLRTVADGNIGSILGIGAPAWTGGYLQFVNTYGLSRFIDRCNELAARYGERFKAPEIVVDTLAAGKTFQ